MFIYEIFCLHYTVNYDRRLTTKMETCIRRSLLGTCVVIVMISCCISGVACDVPDDVVYTDLHKNVRIGDSVVLKCQFRGTPLAVYWKKGYDPNRAPNLVSWIENDDVTGTCAGERVCRIMEMNEDRSLVIKEVSIAEQGRYICIVESYKGMLKHNFTDINVFSLPTKPYPLINECLRSPERKSNQTCIISTTEHSINISCTASGYFPDLHLFFLHGSQYFTTIHSQETKNEDGSKNKSIITQALSSPEPYVCVASDIPGVGGRSIASVLVTTATVFVTPAITASVERSDSTIAVKIVVPLIFIILLVGVILGAIILWRIRQREEAGKTADKRHRPVYLQMAKTFFQIRDEFESEVTNEDLKKFALSLTKQHCQRLGKSLELPENIIAATNENDLGVIFRTDAMLRDWVKGQRGQQCSDYEIRGILRDTAERCERNDIADIFIPKEQSNIKPLTEPDYLTPTDDNQCPRISVSDGSCSKPVETTNPPMCGEIKAKKPMFRRRSRRSSIFSLASTSSENSVEYISREELDRIGRYLGRETLLEFGYNLESGDVVEQQTSNMSEREEPLLSPTSARRAFNRQDSTLSMMNRQPRDTLGKPFRKRHPTYACLLPMKRNDKIFDVELIELAFRLVMADIHPFAKRLGISDQLLTSYKPNFKPKQLNQGTIMMLKAVKTKDRSEMFKVLTTAGYSEEAKAIYFGFEISLDDVLEVENRVDMAQLANKLGVPEDVQPIGLANEISCGERQNSVLFRWKNTVRSSTFNHRLFLSDTIFSMGEKKLALDIISGVYRKRVINNSVSKLLANTMKQEQLSTLCEVLDQKGSNCQDAITAWAGEITERSKLDIVGKYEKKPRKLSNKLLQNGFYHFAYEIMTGAWQRQEDNKAVETRPQGSHIYKAKSKLTDKEMHLQRLDERGLEESSDILAPDTADTAWNMDPTTTTRIQDSNTAGNRQEESDENEIDEISDTPIQETAKMDHVRQK